MKASFDSNYLNGSNQEITKLVQDPSLIKDMIELNGEYTFIDMKLTKDKTIPNAEILEVMAYDNILMNEQNIVFNKYGLQEINFRNGDTLYEDEKKALSFRPALRDTILAYINSMVSVNDEKYAHLLIGHYESKIKKLNYEIEERKKSRLRVHNEEKLITLNNKIIDVIKTTSANKSEQEK